MKRPGFGASLLVVLLAGAGEAFAQDYTVKDLSTIGTGVYGAALNGLGVVVGSHIAFGRRHAFFWEGGALEDLYTPSFPPFNQAPDLFVTGSNASGHIVGSYDLPAWPSFDARAFLYDGVSFRDLGTLGGTYSAANDINASGVIVGESTTAGDQVIYAFRYANGAMSALQNLGANSTASAVNSWGQVTGCRPVSSLADHAYIWASGSVLDLGSLGGSSCGRDINDHGVVVGDYGAPGLPQAFVHDGTAMVDINTLGAYLSWAAAVNDAGVVVGSYVSFSLESKAFVYRIDDGEMLDLDDLVPANVHPTQALDVNAAGEILAMGTIDGLVGERPLLLTPRVLDRFAYTLALSPGYPEPYDPDPTVSYNASGGRILITRQATGRYSVSFDDLVGWSERYSSAVAVTATGEFSASCSAVNYDQVGSRAVVTVECLDLATKVPLDATFGVMVTGNASLGGFSAFLVTGYDFPVSKHFSWTSSPQGVQKVTRVATGVYDVLLGTGNTPKSAKLVTAMFPAGRMCFDVTGISGGLRVKCLDTTGAPADAVFSVVQVAGGRPQRRLGFARCLSASTPSYSPASTISFNSSGGAITVTRWGVGNHVVAFAGLGAPYGAHDHVQVAALADGVPVVCKADGWSTGGNFQVAVECRNLAGQHVDAKFDVLVIE